MWRWALLLALALASLRVLGAELALTDTERDWIESHGPVRVAVARGSEPFYTSADADQAPHGFAIDLLTLAGERAGLQFAYRNVERIPEIARLMLTDQVDVVPMSARTPVREKVASFPGSLMSAQLVYVTRPDTSDLSMSRGFGGRSVGVVEGSAAAELMLTRVHGVQLQRFPDTATMVQAVSQGRVDLGAAWQHEVVYAIEANLLTNLRVHRVREFVSGYYGPAVSVRQPVLNDILSKALASLTPAEKASAARRWLPAGTDTLWAPEQVTLTPAEQEWVRRSGELRVGFDGAFAPITQLTRLGGFDGLGAELLRLVADKAGLRVIQQTAGSFEDVLRGARSGKLDVLVGMARTPERRDAFDFVGPFARSPSALLMRNDSPQVWHSTAEIAGGRLGLLKSHFLLPQIRLRRPALPIVEFDSNEEVLSALSQRRIDVALGNGAVMGRLLQDRYLGRLRITGVEPEGDSELYFGIPKGHPELLRVFQKGFDAVTPGEMATLERHWLTVSVRPGLSSEVLQGLVPAAVVVVVVVAAMYGINRRLRASARAEAQARAAAEEANAARGRFLAYLTHEMRGTIGGIGAGLQLLQAADDAGLRHKLYEASRTSCQDLLGLLETTLAHERTMMLGIHIEPQPMDLADWWERSTTPLAMLARAKGLEFEAEGPDTPASVRADGTRLTQVLNNLATNAIKFTESGRVAARARWDAERHHFQLEVRDTGPGLDPTEAERLFEPYAQGGAGRRAVTGAGLGLAITRQIVQAMGGTVVAMATETGQGATFRAEIPLEPA